MIIIQYHLYYFQYDTVGYYTIIIWYNIDINIYIIL